MEFVGSKLAEEWLPFALSIAVMSTVVLAKVFLNYVAPHLKAVAVEKAMRKQDIPIVPGRKFLAGHPGASLACADPPDQDSSDPHNIYSLLKFQYLNSKAYGPTHVYWRGTEVTLHTLDPEIAKAVFITNFSCFEKSYIQVKQFEDLVGPQGLTSVGGKTWARQRKIVSPAFRMEKLKKLVSPMVQSVDGFVANWVKEAEQAGGSTEIQVNESMPQLTADVILCTAFGTSYNEGRLYFEKEMKIVASIAMKALNGSRVGQSLIPTAENRRIWRLRREIKQLLENIFQQRRGNSKVGDEASYGNDLLGLMMAASEELEPKKRLSNQELIDQTKTFLFAGSDTTATGLMWVLMFLSSHQDWQEKAYTEIKRFCDPGKPFDYDSLNKLKIVGNIINETLRLYPPAVWIQRQAQREVQVGKLYIPTGLTIYVNVPGMQTDPDLWGPDANQFNPDRFADGVSKAAKHPQAFAAFSLGPRNCVGQNFGMLELKVIIASILQRFLLSPSPNYRHRPTLRTMHPKPQFGMPIIFTLRSGS
ncbi:unnamed protein product [Calypogeia fissa]